MFSTRILTLLIQKIICKNHYFILILIRPIGDQKPHRKKDDIAILQEPEGVKVSVACTFPKITLKIKNNDN